jgi:hypothetical protein
MRTYSQIVRVGENMGPIDWNYQFRPHFDNMGTSEAGKDAACELAKRRLKIIEEMFLGMEDIRATNYGGSPRCGIYKVIDVGMYDGWPWWRPVPSVLVHTYLGSEWYTFCRITDIYRGEERIDVG